MHSVHVDNIAITIPDELDRSKWVIPAEIHSANAPRDEHGHPTIVPERRIVIRQLFPGAWPQGISLLGIAIMEKRTLEYVSPETPHRLLTKRQLANIKAGLDTGPERQSFTPEFWQRMEDFLLMTITPACSHQAIRQQAIGENGWWR